MIGGVVNARHEAIIPLTVVGMGSQRQAIDAVVDTGFTGFLTLPSALISSLNLPWLCRQSGMLADGTVANFDVYVVTIVWDGRPRTIEVEEANCDPLVGMGLLRDHRLRIDVAVGGGVSIQVLP
ncbi:MAG: clan AA aspartic protease [Planctomycetes bacterium]|nr:clan AA aspartic protease [Planctomycetota bacterium]